MDNTLVLLASTQRIGGLYQNSVGTVLSWQIIL
jgi:hypothetical protein